MKAYSSVPGRLPLRQLYSLTSYKLRNAAGIVGAHHRSFQRIRHLLETHLAQPLVGKRLLEIGCGQWQANARLLAALGNKVIGVDPELPPTDLPSYIAFAQEMGLQRATKSAASRIFARFYYDPELKRVSGVDLDKGECQLLRARGEALPLPDASVDAAVSDNVFEHLPSVDRVVSEIRRVLKPGGISAIIIHPFTALSGGHDLAVVSHDGEPHDLPVQPWRHLLEDQGPEDVYLNRLRAADYRRIFENAFETLTWETLGPEGERFLTPELLERLPGYTRDELLTGKIVYVGRKPDEA